MERWLRFNPKKTTHEGVVEPISRIKLLEQLACTVSFRSDLFV